MTVDLQRLLLSNELPPFETVNAGASSPLILTGDHAGNAIPLALGSLGVADHDRHRHIGWDIGVEGLGRRLAARLDATFVYQRYSRLVIDCNRDTRAPDAIPIASDGTAVPGNAGLSQAARQARIEEIHSPYHATVAAALAARPAPVLIALHSFTPVMDGVVRVWELGILHAGHNDGFARQLLGWLTRQSGLTIGDNVPYAMDGTDYSVPFHAFAADLPYVELEVRQDLLTGVNGVEAVARLLAEALGSIAP